MNIYFKIHCVTDKHLYQLQIYWAKCEREKERRRNIVFIAIYYKHSFTVCMRT